MIQVERFQKKVFLLASSLLLLASPFGSFAGAAPFAKVLNKQGSVTFAGKEVEVGAELGETGELITSETGRVEIEWTQSKGKLVLAPGTRLELSSKWRDKEAKLLSGSVKFDLHANKKMKKKFRLRTQTAVMGVRGTRFMAVFSPLLKESEIVVFDGKVRFQNAKNKKDAKLVPAGHWGGIGGRFRSKVGKLIRLPSEVLRSFEASFSLDR